jgi:rubrerythrin
MTAAQETDARADSLSLLCSQCGYGVARSLPPARCPMCQARGHSWLPLRKMGSRPHVGGKGETES